MQTLLVISRILHFTAAIALAGVFAFDRLVAAPAFRAAGVDYAAAAAAGLRRRFRRLAWASLALALLSGAGWLLAITADMSGKPLGFALSHGLVGVVLTGTRFGEDWLLRLTGALVLAILLVVRFNQRPGLAAAIGWARLAVAALVLASLAWAGHGAATAGAVGQLHLAGDILHLLAAGSWLGTLPPLALLLATAAPSDDAQRADIIRAGTRYYSMLAIASVAALLLGGFVNTWFLAGSVPALIGTQYGRLLLGKIALVVAMLVVAAVNLLRLTPRLAGPDRSAAMCAATALRRNAWIEAGLGLGALAIVGLIGILPPGLHEEPGWPLPVRLDLAALAMGKRVLLFVLAALLCGCGIAAVVTAASGHWRRAVAAAAGLALCAAAVAILLAPFVEPAYPTSFYAPAEPYAAASVVRGAAVYAGNCAGCHGKSGRGDGPAAAGLPVRPADLTEPHLLAHSVGDLFWWISRGRANGAMPGFAAALRPNRRWDVINFIRARAAGRLARQADGEITSAAAYPVPDFAFAAERGQDTLRHVLEGGPALLMLFRPPAPAARLRDLAAVQPRLAAAGLHILAIDLGETGGDRDTARSPLVVAVSSDVRAALALFQGPADGGETELLLDKNGEVRARWTDNGREGLPDAAALLAVAARAARFAIAGPSHSGHAE